MPNSGTTVVSDVAYKGPVTASDITFAGPIPLISEFAPIVIGAPFTVPIRWLFAPIVVAPAGIQITREDIAPSTSMTSVFAAWFNAPLILKMCNPLSVKVIGPEPMFASPLIQYTPGG